ncbi:hypothetical protein BC629DRAFT_1595251 [Irpex lacteus]|nr:hypothetical protein BC629DRAFT_1595251 [Irpex lacteus]
MPFKLSTPLVAVSLDEVLSGATCEPISLADFESFLTHKQHAVEYLRFVVWYRSYHSRFQSLPVELRNLSPPVSAYDCAGLDCKLPSPARLARFVTQASSTTSTSYDGLYITPSRSTTGSSLDVERQPFRAECACVARTFLVSNPSVHSTTLDIQSEVLDATLAYLSQTTNPSVFHPIYQQAYDTLQNSSLPYFLAEATPNINREKQLYWWLYGAISFLLGWAVTIGCLFINKHDGESARPASVRERAWRLWAVPFLTAGGMQMYSAYRGFCSEVWGRGATQLRPWELVSATDEELQSGSDKKEPLSSQGEAHYWQKGPKPLKPLEHVAENPDEAVQIDISSVHFDDLANVDLNIDSPGPVTLPSSLSSPASTSKKRPPPIITSNHRDHWCPPPNFASVDMSRTATAVSAPSHGTSTQRDLHPLPHVACPPKTSSTASQTTLPVLSTRARMFGPERVVMDPRIRAVHRRILRDMLVVGFIWSVVWTVVILCLPWSR